MNRIKRWTIEAICGVPVGLAFVFAGKVQPSWLAALALWGAFMLLTALYIPRFPRAEAMRQALRGERIEVEGK